MSAGVDPFAVTTARTWPSSSVSNPVTSVSVCNSMPMLRIASATSAPMSGSSVDIGCGAASTIVTVKPRFFIASAISSPM